MTLTFLAASSIGLPNAANWVGAITMAAGFSETAFSRIPICPLMSDSDWAPSCGTLTSRSWPALLAPANTICQKKEVVSLTMIGMVGLSAAGTVWTVPAKVIAPNKPSTLRRFKNELNGFMGGNLAIKLPQLGIRVGRGAIHIGYYKILRRRDPAESVMNSAGGCKAFFKIVVARGQAVENWA